MEISRISRRRILVGGILVIVVAFAAAVLSFPGRTPQASPRMTSAGPDRLSAPPPRTPAPPAPTPIAGASDYHPLPDCEPGSTSHAGEPEPVEAPAAGSVSLELVGQLGGSSPGVALSGGRLLMGQGQRVAGFDVADPSRPRPSGSSDALPGTVSALAESESVVVAGLGMSGVALLGPDDLALLGMLALPGWVESVAIHGALAFVADGPGGLRVIDISTPAAPRELGVALDLHRVMDVVVAGSTAYLAAADEGLVVVDVSDPSNPSRVGGLTTGGYAYGLDVESGIAYLADAWGGLAAIDVANAAAPRLIATQPTSAWVTAVDAAGGRAFAAAGSDGLLALDVAQPGLPVVIGSLPMPAAGAVGLVVAGTTAIVATGSQGAAIVDVGAPERLTVVASVTPFGSAQAVALVGDRAYLAARDQGLRIVDVADPAGPREIGQVLTRDEVTAVTAVGSTVFFWTIPTPESGASHSIFGLSLEDPGSLTPETPLHVGVTVGATTTGNVVLVGNESGMQVIDGSSATPCELGFVQTLEEGRALAGGVTAAGDVAYVSVGETGFYVVDLADPRRPTRIGGAPLPPRGKSTNAVLVAGSMLYTLTNGHDGEIVAVYDVAQPRSPRLLGTLTLPDLSLALGEDGVQPLAYSRGRLFVADGPGGLVVVDVSRPAKLAVAGRIDLPGKAASVVARGDLVYVAVQGQGLSIVRWSAGAPAAGALEARREPASLVGLAGSDPGERAELAMQIGAAACVVSTTRDSGPGTLRACLDGASPGLEITFDPGTFPRRNPRTIRLRSPLPQLESVTIDASGTGVILDGDHEIATGLQIGSASEVRGMTVTGFVAAGIYVDGAGNVIAKNVIGGNEHAGLVLFGGDNRVVGNLIGPDPTGRRGWRPQEFGLQIHDTASMIGGTDPDARNVIAGNFLEVVFKQAHGNTLEGNYIGIDQTGTRLLRPTADRAAFGAIGTDFNAGGNVIRGNVVGGGIFIGGADLGTSYNEIVGNLIGVDASGTRALPCECHGIVAGSPYTRIGGIRPGDGNVVNGGIVVSGHDVIVLGNRLGTDVDGQSLGAPGGGPLFFDSAQRNVAGGAADGAANYVIGPVGVRLFSGSTSNLVIGNSLQARAYFEEEESVGIHVAASTGNLLVGNRVESGEVGIALEQGADGNLLRGNTLAKNDLGVHAASSGNVIVLNAFTGNRRAAIDQGGANRWDDGLLGNYWSDWTAPDANRDGIVDTPRDVPHNGRDRFPLVAAPYPEDG